MGPHNLSEGSQVEGHSLGVDVGHLESPWGTCHRDSSRGDGAGLLGDRGTPNHMLCMRGPWRCGHLDNRDNRRRDRHLSCQSHPGSSPPSSRPQLVGHHVAYQRTGSAHQGPYVG